MFIGIIGTAARSNKQKFNKAIWDKMCQQYLREVEALALQSDQEIHLISGGAAWSDHVAVWAYLNGHCDNLTLYLPSLFDIDKNRFYQERSYERSAANVMNYHHKNFSQTIGENSLEQIRLAMDKGAKCFQEGYRVSLSGLFVRNDKIAQNSKDVMFAYSQDKEDEPSSSGTLYTWNKSIAPYKKVIHIFG